MFLFYTKKIYVSFFHQLILIYFIPVFIIVMLSSNLYSRRFHCVQDNSGYCKGTPVWGNTIKRWRPQPAPPLRLPHSPENLLFPSLQPRRPRKPPNRKGAKKPDPAFLTFLTPVPTPLTWSHQPPGVLPHKSSKWQTSHFPLPTVYKNKLLRHSLPVPFLLSSSETEELARALPS